MPNPPTYEMCEWCRAERATEHEFVPHPSKAGRKLDLRVCARCAKLIEDRTAEAEEEKQRRRDERRARGF